MNDDEHGGLLAIAAAVMMLLCGQTMQAELCFVPTKPFSDLQPVVDIPNGYRQQNWAPYGEGSCVHASMVMILRWQGHTELADWWRKSFNGGEYPNTMNQKLTEAGISFAETTSGDVEFLEWSIRTRRGCCVTIMGGAHMVCLVGLDDQYAWILDNNDPDNIARWTRKGFLNEWHNSGHQWAVTPVYDPPPRKPKL